MDSFVQRRSILGLGAAAGAVFAAGAALDPRKAAAQAASESVLRTALDRGKLIVGTGSTNPPWHFEDDKGNLTKEALRKVLQQYIDAFAAFVVKHNK